MNEASTHLKLDWRIVSGLLVAVIAIMLVIWRPWQAATPVKTVTVSGEATVSHTPDRFSFQPTYTDIDVAKVSVTGNATVTKLKQLGVKTADIKTDVSSSKGVPEPLIGGEGTSGKPMMPILTNPSATYTITFNVGSKALAQTVADYLASTPASGIITPEASFATATKSTLDIEARRKASANAKQKAEALAGQLGAKIGRVIKISDDTNVVSPFEGSSSKVTAQATDTAAPIVEPGTDEVRYQFTVEFELK